MSNEVVLAIISGIVSVSTSIVSAVIVWFKARDAVIVGNSNTVGIEEVHKVVNSQRTEMQAEINALKVLLEQSRKETSALAGAQAKIISEGT